MIRSRSMTRAGLATLFAEVAASALLGFCGCGARADQAARGLEVLERARVAERALSYRGVRFERILYDGGDLRGRVHVHHGPDRSTTTFASTDVPRPAALAAQIAESSDAVSIWLRGALGADATADRLVEGLNGVLLEPRRWNAELFADLPEALELRSALPPAAGADRIRLRRALLATAYPGLVRSGEAGTREVRTWMNEANEATSRFEAENGTIAWLGAPERLVESYRVVPDGSESIAGRLADRYRVVSFRPQRFSRRIWVDHENGFLLRDLAADARGRVVEERRYEFIEFGVGAPDPGFGVARDEEDEVVLEPIAFERLADRVAFAVFAPRSLPAGFPSDAPEARWSGDAAGPVHLIYGDGLARVVLRQRRSAEPPASPAKRGSPAVEVRRRIDGGTTRLAFVLGRTEIDVTSSNLDAALLNGIVASLQVLASSGGES